MVSDAEFEIQLYETDIKYGEIQNTVCSRSVGGARVEAQWKFTTAVKLELTNQEYIKLRAGERK